jgi:hypothetical protein
LEEQLLRGTFGDSYEIWRGRTPVLLPWRGGWKRAAYPLYWRRVLAREYPTQLALTLSFAGIEVAGRWQSGYEWKRSADWAIAVGVSISIYFTGRILKKWGYLDIPDR